MDCKIESKKQMNTTVTFNYIVDTLAREFELNVEDVLSGKGRKQEITLCRHLIAYFCRKYIPSKTYKDKPMQLTEIGKRLNKHHASIIHAEKNVNDFMRFNRSFREKVKYYDQLIAKPKAEARCSCCGLLTK